MIDSKTDPRILRTRKLIMDSFIDLSEKKEFKDITVKDITTEAMINRATFYYHVQDKYDLWGFWCKNCKILANNL
ncbi:transcriptional regulator, TetR family [Bacillus thermotolerans]|uniref:Transcriptional regulator, TetR family n=1 Tax=Bacillus thermotolerans TaxID=1221996 RepID=A0A0F5HJT8_BACTR|nr:transcriptional regulator, TetR family [Bacillus thermotolerans]KKB33984.1 transcriptional regulator, TetR family [Bacillus thermotolerans]